MWLDLCGVLVLVFDRLALSLLRGLSALKNIVTCAGAYISTEELRNIVTSAGAYISTKELRNIVTSVGA